MNWSSLQDFLSMGGQAAYVWGSVLVVLGMMVAELVMLALRWQTVRRYLGRWCRMGAERCDEVSV